MTDKPKREAVQNPRTSEDRAKEIAKVVRESAERYRETISEVNRTRDADIQKSMRARA